MAKYNLDSASLEHDELVFDIEEFLEPSPECCIYKVPKNLRKINEEAYTPRLISIGPFHQDKEELFDMEKQKVRYQKKFNERITQCKWKELKSFIENHEQKIRRHYSEPFEISNDKFVKMILYDAVFIIELFLRFYVRDKSDDFLLNKLWLVAIRQDLQLLENQLPYFVLDELYNLVFPKTPNGDQIFPSFFTLSCIFFQLHLSPYKAPFEKAIKVKHFTDLCRHVLVEPVPKTKGPIIEDLPNAMKLRKSGVKFKPIRGKHLLDVKFKQKIQPFSFFIEVELQIQRFEASDAMESLARNLMALEQCHYPSETYIRSYLELMNFLIHTKKDVELLVEEGIISKFAVDNAVIAEKFNKLSLQIPAYNGSYYSDIFRELRRHYDNPWNHAKTTLKKVYLSNPWRGTGTVVAIIFLLLTWLQTVCSIVQLL